MKNVVQPGFENLVAQAEEYLIEDERSQRSPSQLVEARLIELLRRGPLTVSQTRGLSLTPNRLQFHE